VVDAGGCVEYELSEVKVKINIVVVPIVAG
jgi:hypothetical protein